MSITGADCVYKGASCVISGHAWVILVALGSSILITEGDVIVFWSHDMALQQLKDSPKWSRVQ